MAVLTLIVIILYCILSRRVSDSVSEHSSNIIYCFWTGNNKMSNERKAALESLQNDSGCKVILITPANLSEYILPEHPIHSAYEYLSYTHKADFLRTYFMRFHGGGYADIKKQTGSWVDSFEKLRKDNRYWILGYPEVPGGVAYQPYGDKWKELIGNGAYICRPNTPLTIEWYDDMIRLLDSKMERLQQNPASYPQDCAESGSGYPLEWNEMLGRIFHKVCYRYRGRLLNTLPIPIFTNYR